jgi:2-dehydropantoate 2-reductase
MNQKNRKMKLTIIGTGGVGGYFGAKLAKAGNDVTFIARGAHLAAMQKNGLTVKSIDGDFQVKNFTATDQLSEAGPTDLIILGVKAWQIKEIRNALKPLIHEDTIVLPLQNGVLAADELQETIDKKHILGGLCRIISKIESPGVINHFGIKPSIVFGELDHSDSAREQKLKQLFDGAEIHSTVSFDIQSDVWKKFISICVSGLLAVTHSTYGELRELPETRQMMLDLLNEIYVLSQRMGMHIEPGFVTKAVSYIDTLSYDATASLTRDVWEGKPSEIEYQNGTVVRLAEKHGIETPVNRFVYNCILPMELKARNPKASRQ